LEQAVLKLEKVVFSYGGTEVLHEISFSLKGEVVGLLGPNGAGKAPPSRSSPVSSLRPVASFQLPVSNFRNEPSR
jgi:ABC-type Fe3+/spermidine/putrescine transport system ATPase subunit